MTQIKLQIKMVEDEPPMQCKFKCKTLKECLSTVLRFTQNFYNEAYHQTFHQQYQQFPMNIQQQQQNRRTYIIDSPEMSTINVENRNRMQSAIRQILTTSGNVSNQEDIKEEAALMTNHLTQVIKQSTFLLDISSVYVGQSFDQLYQQIKQQYGGELGLEETQAVSAEQSSLDIQGKSRGHYRR